MVRIHIGLDLEHEAGHLAFVRLGGGLRAGRGREFGQRVDELLDAEILQRAAEQDRRHILAFEKGLFVEPLQPLDREMKLIERFCVGAGVAQGPATTLRAGVERDQGRSFRMSPVSAGERAAAAIVQWSGAASSASVFSISSMRSNGLLGLAVHLVDEG